MRHDRIIPAIVAGITLTCAVPATAASWQVVDSSASVQTEVDLATAVRKDGSVTGWVQHTYSRKTTTQTGAYFVYRTMKEQLRLDCSQQTATILVRGYFDDEGNEIASIKGKGETRNVMPDTPDHRVLSRLCNPTAENKPAKAKSVAAPAPAAARYMDGPAPPAHPLPGIIRAKADAHDAPPAAAAAIAKPADKAEAAPTLKAEAKSAEKTAPPAEKSPAAQHGKSSREVSNPAETRETTVARVMKERAGAPFPVHSPRSRPARNAAQADHGAAQTAGPGHEVHWTYEGEFAPYRWGDLKSDYATCKAGTRQSPIDIRNAVMSDSEPVQFFYEDVPLKVTNNGHTIQVDYAPGSFILFGGARYELVQFHFHTPSEERINGRAFDMVAHLVHKSAQGRLAVVAVLLTAGREQSMLQAVWNAMPGTPSRTRERLDIAINARQLLPSDSTYYSYMGSLTTPPCTEGVQWLVMKTPVEISREQIAHFTALYPMNARPLQASNDRLIKAGK